jgi:V8-like Glu-specific endopeptidase
MPKKKSNKSRASNFVSRSHAPTPIKEKDLRRKIRNRKPTKKIEGFDLELDLNFAEVKTAKLKAKRMTKSRKPALKSQRMIKEKLGKSVGMKIKIQNVQLGTRVFAPDIKGALVPYPKSSTARINKAKLGLPDLPGFLPDHLALTTIPPKLGKKFQKVNFISHKKLRGKDIHQATTIFSPDDRYTFSDTAYPWSTIGRVDTAGGYASGVMIGPRHLLTVSHVMQWGSGNSAGWVRFRPSYFDGNAPFGEAYATRWYAYKKVVGPGINRSEGRQDYVVLVLDRRLGDITGWMGSRTYSDSWDGGSYWRHIGYPGDIAAGQRPSYERDISLDGSFWDSQSHQRIWHRGDVWPGQSGGPFFAWWSGENFPRVVAVQSGQNPSENSASGGSRMVDLIIRARNENP